MASSSSDELEYGDAGLPVSEAKMAKELEIDWNKAIAEMERKKRVVSDQS
jgi:hypothetical protein